MNETRVTTGEVRFSYVHVFKPYAYQVGAEEKYSVTCLLPKSDTVTKARLDAAIEAAKQTGISKVWQGVCPPVVPVPIHDGDGTKQDGTPFPAECKGCWVFTASAKADRPPEVVDAQLNPIINQAEVYSGCYGRVNINIYPYLYGGKKGIGFGLGPVQKLRDGEALGGGSVSAASAFGAPAPQAATAFGAPAPATDINPLTGLPL